MKNLEKGPGSSLCRPKYGPQSAHYASTKGLDQLSTSEQLQLLGKREASLEVAATEELGEGLLEER